MQPTGDEQQRPTKKEQCLNYTEELIDQMSNSLFTG